MRQIQLNYENLELSGYDFQGLCLAGASFKKSNLTGARFINSNLEGANFLGSDLTAANFEGANLFCVNFEGAILEDVRIDERTRYFKMKCPEAGAFLGYKKCFNSRIVQLLIPEDAKRCSATSDACRCDKAKVLSIKSVDLKRVYDNAYSYFNENFVYRTGEMVYVDGFCENRWKDSSQGIHFYMTRKEALSYL